MVKVLETTYDVSTRSDLNAGVFFRVGIRGWVDVFMSMPIQVVIVLFFHARTLILAFVLILAHIAGRANGSRNGTTSFHLFTRNQISRTQHPDIIPPLHHIFATSGSK